MNNKSECAIEIDEGDARRLLAGMEEYLKREGSGAGNNNQPKIQRSPTSQPGLDELRAMGGQRLGTQRREGEREGDIQGGF